MKPTVSVSSGRDSVATLKSTLSSLVRKKVLVGIPEDKTDRRSGEMTNAGLMYIHTHGSALQHIPARPVIEPAIQAPDNKLMIANQLGDAARLALAGKKGEANQSLGAAGMLGRNAAIRWFTDPRNGWAPNSPRTAEEKGSDRPLIDTAQMRRSITYSVEDK